MTAVELARWLEDHGHVDVEIQGDDQVASTLRGKPLTYVLSNIDGLAVCGDRWTIRRGRAR